MEKSKNNLRPFEVTIISAEALSLGKKRPVKKNAFVIIKAYPNYDQNTTMDTENGAYPSWNQKFLVEMDMHVKFFVLEVHCKNSSGDHIVGSARVPVSDFRGGYFPSNYLHFLSYRLRDRYGERNGIINLSVKIKSSSNYEANMGQNVSHGVVIGVPISNGY